MMGQGRHYGRMIRLCQLCEININIIKKSPSNGRVFIENRKGFRRLIIVMTNAYVPCEMDYRYNSLLLP